jgi:hypothetical protein
VIGDAAVPVPVGDVAEVPPPAGGTGQVRLAEATAQYLAEREVLAALEERLAAHVAGYRRQLAEPVTVAVLRHSGIITIN